MAPGSNGVGVQVDDLKICVVMVGLPARGKSYIAGKSKSSPPGGQEMLPPMCEEPVPN